MNVLLCCTPAFDVWSLLFGTLKVRLVG